MNRFVTCWCYNAFNGKKRKIMWYSECSCVKYWGGSEVNSVHVESIGQRRRPWSDTAYLQPHKHNLITGHHRVTRNWPRCGFGLHHHVMSQGTWRFSIVIIKVTLIHRVSWWYSHHGEKVPSLPRNTRGSKPISTIKWRKKRECSGRSSVS